MVNRKIKIIDSTLRDGNHTVGNRFDLDDIKSIVKTLDQSGIDYIEVGYGFGMGSFNKEGFATDYQILDAAIGKAKNSKIAILVFPNKADIKSYEKLLDYDIGLIRLAVQASNVEPAKDYIKLARDKGIQVGGFMMMASRLSADEITSEASKLKKFGADTITITDSAGAMIPSSVVDTIKKVKEATKLEIGFHTHDNLGLAVGNSMLAISSGASFIDTAIAGLGAGAGNTRTESLVAVLDKEGYKINADMFKSIECVKVLDKIIKKYDVNIKDMRDMILIGYYGIYSAFMKNVSDLSDKYGVSKKYLIANIAKNRYVPGDEEKIESLAKMLR
ncbi:MAG: hypothetical protein E7D92_00280 [Anaerococcus sp.]|uniref:hypothetical protein n=1 Tax=Anaerococcus sp. TaxID=1872515 RepID=UPI0029013BB7|nr:hypothetical protein [Anaerococcus sp.]MDU2353031.1 hypothetical protein [Anaerococcus sp.]